MRLDASSDPVDRAAANDLWATIEREVVDAAAAVMPFDVTDVDFVSKRVGNVQIHPLWALLLDQLWVQ